MDRSWIHLPRTTREYLEGLESFLDFAVAHVDAGQDILCPCPKCNFKKWYQRSVVRDHLILKPFPQGYTCWIMHGETQGASERVRNSPAQSQVGVEICRDDAMNEVVRDAFGVHGDNIFCEEVEGPDPIFMSQMNEEAKDFYELMRDGEKPLFPSCTKYTKLSFLVRLYHIKCLCGMSNKAMSMILELLGDAFPNAEIPTSYYEGKKAITKLGLNYKKIDACPNDCMLYWGDDADKEACKKCKTSRWKQVKKGKKKQKQKPAKILRYFPLKPRLQRLYMSSKTAELMRWHYDEKNTDGLMRHPRDSEAWKSFDVHYPDFAADPRNVRLALATDGFNPFGNLSTSYSIWPVVLIPYNLPPWLCMKQSSFFLSMIIPGRRAPGNDIDVYLQPLIRELEDLWNVGVETFDSHEKKLFNLRAAIMWTISDFPGLGTLSGWNVHTGLACPSCNFDSDPLRLSHSRKWCFWGHRRFLDGKHKFRLTRTRFDGKQELRTPPLILSGSDILRQLQDVSVVFGKDVESEGTGKRRRVANEGETRQWRKRSIFFDLPYWTSNLLRHSLDVMHIEKNVCDNLLFTILNEVGKSKDNTGSRKDLQELGIRPELWVDENDKFQPAIFTLTKDNKEIFLRTLKKITVPDGYSSNIARCIDLRTRKIGGLKSHDSHVLMQQLLPLAVRNTLPKEVSAVIVDLCSFFRKLCSKALSVDELEQLEKKIIETLCHLEMIFPPSFFTVMVHLTVHLAGEAKVAGPVQYRWMYPIERFLGKLKSYVRNRAWPEGSIAEGFLGDEVLTFCSRYFEGVETVFNRPQRVDDYPDEGPSTSNSLFPPVGKVVGGFEYFTLTAKEKLQAHRHVLTNCRQVDPFIQEFRSVVKRQMRSRTRSSAEVDKRVHREFVDWFSRRIGNDHSGSHSVEFRMLSLGPIDNARRFTAYNVNGFKFRTVGRDEGLQTQNCGVFGTFGTRSYASRNDGDMHFGGVPYYGKLVDIIELNYNGRFTVILFKCAWANTTTSRGVMTDDLGITSINFSRLIHTGENDDDEPYILANEAHQVYYVEDEKHKDWNMVVHVKPRDLYDMGDETDTTYEIEPIGPTNLESLFPEGDENLALTRLIYFQIGLFFYVYI